MFHKLATGWVLLFIICMVFSPSIVFAQFPDKIVPCEGVDCNICDIGTLAQNVLNAGIYIAVFIAAILFAWAGWLHVTAGGDSGKVRSARSIFTNVLLGLVIILAGWLVVDTLMRLLLGTDTGFLKPWEPLC